jgi:hypothetical protein
MKKYFKHILVVCVGILLVIQFIQPARNLDNGKPLPVHFVNSFHPPQKVQALLQASCYDCHSNNTVYPWYSNIQPVRFFLDDHIKEGKKELNFSEYGNYSKRKQLGKLKGMAKEIKSGDMPLSSYTLIHRYAILSPEDKQILLTWIEKTRDSLTVKN